MPDLKFPIKSDQLGFIQTYELQTYKPHKAFYATVS